MRIKFLFPALLFATAGWLFFNCLHRPNLRPPTSKLTPSEWFFTQRAWPQGRVPQAVYRQSLQQAQALRGAAQTRSGAVWQAAGPTNVGGRVTALAIHPAQPDTWFVGAASGGIFKSTDAGTSWAPVFDDAPSLSIGDLAVAPSDPLTLYAGTGEANGGGGSMTYDGLGVFKTTDGGMSWAALGLDNIGNVGKIAVHPTDPDRVFVAAMGDLFGDTPDRGIYRTVDGGLSWEKVLFVSDSTGGIDVAIHPQNPDTVYAALWERVRRPNYRKYGGDSGGIFRSTDGGDTWSQLGGGLPASDIGRIGLAVTPAAPEVVYAIYADAFGTHKSMWKSTDNGETWSETDPGNQLAGNGASFAWWFGKIFAHPTDADRVFSTGLDLYESTDGGQSWASSSGGVHVDQHALWMNPNDPDQLVLGNDGGLYAAPAPFVWSHKNTLPITQFYACEIDEQNPGHLLGGAQDNGTNATDGPTDGWQHILGGDGFTCLVDPVDPDFVYAEYQYGNIARSDNGGFSFNFLLGGFQNDRLNWHTPYVLDPQDPATLYLGGSKLYKSTNRGDSWAAISPNLTAGNGGLYPVVFNTITTIAVSPQNPAVLWVGCDDGNVQVTQNGGANWQNVGAQLPDRWITRVAADPQNPAAAYVALSGYRWHEYQPHLLKTTDFGQNWSDISANLPEAPVNDVVPDPAQPGTLYAATDVGVFVSHNDGGTWEALGTGLPLVPVLDLRLHGPSRQLAAATYGRSMYTIDLQELGATFPNAAAQIFIKISPNPFTEAAMAQVRFFQKTDASLEVLDLSGRLIRTLHQGPVGPEAIVFGLQRSDFPSGGVYLLRLRTRDAEQVKRFVVF